MNLLRKECTKDVNKNLTKAIEEPGAMKMNNFKKNITMLLPTKERLGRSLKLMKESSKKKK